MGFFVAFLVGLAFTVVGELLRPKQKVPNAKASALDEFEVPTAEEGRSIPVFCGKVLITGSNVTWYGDLRTVALKQKVKTGLWSSERQTYAHKYYLGLQHALGFGDASVTIHRVLWGDYPNEPSHSRAVQADGSTLFTYNDENFFGGNKEEGGLVGTMRFYPGNSTQEPNAYMTGVLGEQFPGYRGLTHAIVEGMYLGTQKYIKPPSFEVSRYPNQLGLTSSRHIIDDDCNPVCFMFELLTNQVWGVGKTSADIDIAQWRTVANTVFDEGFGMSMLYNGSASAESILGDILRHVDGVIFPDPSTGLLTIRLARKDYVKDDLPVYTGADFMEGIKFSRPSWSETTNTILVTYTNRERDYEQGVYPLQDLANIMQRGGELAVDELDFSGFTTLPPVQAATARALRTMSYPLAKASGVVGRKAWRVLPADVIRVQWPELGVDDVVFRVTNINRAGIRENRIGLELVEDIFSLTDAAYGPPASSDWVNPVSASAALARQQLVEAPYFLQGSDGSNILTLGSRSGGLDLGYQVRIGDTAGALVQASTSEDFSASGLTSATVTAAATSFTVTGMLAVEETNQAPTDSNQISGDTLVLLKSSTTEELVAYRNVSGSTYSNVWRGLLDTVPQEHPAGTQAWFLTSGFHIGNQQPYTTGFPKTQYAKLLPYNVLGALPEADAVGMSLSLVDRAARPYPPGKIRVNGSAAPGGTVSNSFTFSWAHRNRTTQETMVTQDADSVTPEVGTTYTIRAYNASMGLIVEKTGISPTANAAAINLNYTGNVTVEITAVRNGLSSYQTQRIAFAYTGTGTSSITADEAAYVLDGGGA